jgi:shikimate kinase
MNLKLKRTPGIYIVGFVSAGKSTIGRHLAERLGWSFFDTDHELEAAEKMTVSQLYAERGEPEFRRLETAVLRRHVAWIERGRPAVLALGGGAFIEPANRDLLCDRGISLWLDCPLEIVQRRIASGAHRVLAQDPDRFAALYTARREAYQRADVRIPIEGDDPQPVLDAILASPVLK